MIVKDVTAEQYSFRCSKCDSTWAVEYTVEHVEDGHGHAHDYYLRNGMPSLNPRAVPPLCSSCGIADVTVTLVGTRSARTDPEAAPVAPPAPPAATGETWMRVVTYQPKVPGDRTAIDYIRSSAQGVLRMLEGMSGFRRGYWGEDASTGTVSAVTYWDSLESINAVAETLNRLQAERARYGVIVRSTTNIRLIDAAGATAPEAVGAES